VALESQSRDVTVESQKKKGIGVVQAANNQIMAGILKVLSCL
jgi:hypothetical protein